MSGSSKESFYCFGTRVSFRNHKKFAAEERETGTRSKICNAGAREHKDKIEECGHSECKGIQECTAISELLYILYYPLK